MFFFEPVVGTQVLSWSLFLFVSFFFSALTFIKKTFSFKGIVFGNILGLFVFLWGGMPAFAMLAVFFLLGETATIYSRKKTGVAHEKRDVANVLGNALASLIALSFGSVPAFFGGISAALSDTLSSEIGLLSKTKPRLITTFKEVAHGTNGGVTALGSMAAVFGAAVTGLIFFLFSQNMTLSIFVFFAGITGSTFDSLLGAVFENKGKLDKAQVNFLATSFGALVVFFLQVLTSTF